MEAIYSSETSVGFERTTRDMSQMIELFNMYLYVYKRAHAHSLVTIPRSNFTFFPLQVQIFTASSFKIYFNIILPLTTTSLTWPTFSRILYQNIAPIFIPHSCCMCRISHRPWLNPSNSVRWKVQIMELLIRIMFSTLLLGAPSRIQMFSSGSFKQWVWMPLRACNLPLVYNGGRQWFNRTKKMTVSYLHCTTPKPCLASNYFLWVYS
jgi:hypothetical protein